MLDAPSVSDAEYDRLYDELAALEEAHPELVTPDSPTQRVGAPASDRFQKVRHLEQMGSLEKVTTAEALVKWADDVRKRLGTDEPVAYVVEPKIDGLRGQPDLRERRPRPRGDARRRRAGRGRDAQPPDDLRDPAAHAWATSRRRSSRSAARSTCRSRASAS